MAAGTPGPNGRTDRLLDVIDLVKWFPVSAGFLGRPRAHNKAVDGVTFHIARRETLGLVGESGCGKTTLARAVVRLVEPTAGRVYFEGQDLSALSARQVNRLRPRMQIIYQDPYGSLNPRLPVMEIVGEAVRYHGIARGRDAEQLVKEVLARVGLSPAYAERYPHEFSGGQRQRIGIARALAMNPALIICDEPVSALDVSIQSQILNLLKDLQQQYGMAFLFIAHGLHVVRHVSDRVAVMYLGRIVEIAPSRSLYADPQHPYTRALVSAIPLPDPRRRRRERRILLEGDVPSPIDPPSGCRFHTRCWLAEPRCSEVVPQPVEVAHGHVVWCHLAKGRSG